MMGVNFLREIDVQCDQGSDLDAVQSDITALMRQRHKVQPSEPDDVMIQNQAQFVEAFSAVDSGDIHDFAGHGRWDFAAGGWNRDHEYHAGDRHAERTRENRNSQGHRRQGI